MNKTLLLTACVFTVLCSCRKENPAQEFDQKTNLTPIDANVRYNPYALKNMKKAARRMLESQNKYVLDYKTSRNGVAAGMNGNPHQRLSSAESKEVVENTMAATHYYIKFKPLNEAQLAVLKSDSTITIYPFPLDAEVNPYKGNYRDPAVPTGQPTYQYAAVEVDKVLPKIPLEKLEELYLPDERKATNTVKLQDGNQLYTLNARMLTQESMCDGPSPVEPQQVENLGKNSNGYNKLTQLAPPEDCTEGGGSTGGGSGGGSGDPYRNGDDWRPHGRITVYDEVKNQIIGVEGIRVRARRWFTTYNGFTDGNGYYAVDGWFTRPANYWLDFERYEFSVNDHGGGPREVGGPKIEDAWNVQFEDYDKFCSTIFRAAYHYYYKDIQGLNRPPENGFWNTQMKLGAYNENNAEDNGNHALSDVYLESAKRYISTTLTEE
ncbi:hypothetical protein [Pedobacter sp. KLB.chiD]|uniref:hypothetical protein n=1 Tax=Pedobacter sp. KLB.chiD TaxID=3387402 RepID=UPI00399ADC28